MSNVTSPLLVAKSTDEFAPQAPSAAVREAAARFDERVTAIAPKLGLSAADHAFDRRGTATALRALDAAHGGGFFSLDEATETDEDAAAAAFAGNAPVVDVQTHFIDPGAWDRPSADGLKWFLTMVDERRWGGGVDPRSDRCGRVGHPRLRDQRDGSGAPHLDARIGRRQRAHQSSDRGRARHGRQVRRLGPCADPHHRASEPGPAEIDQMADWKAELSPSGWKVYTLYGPPTAASPTGGWFLDDEEIGMPFLEQVRALGPRVVASHKGLGGPIPDASVAAASPRDIGPAALAFPDIDFVVYHSGYERNPEGEEGPYDAAAPNDGVDRLVKTVETAGIGPEGNVYAELGSTWYLMLRRPAEAAHVFGKLLTSVGPDRIVWGTDSIWYGSPQPLIDAFRSFQIPESFQEKYGYPALTAETKDKILSHNARRVYAVSDTALADAAGSLGASAAWVGGASTELRRVMTA